MGRRIAFTLCALLVYRLGSHIPIPGIDAAAWEQLFRSQTDFLSNSAGIHRLAVFALGITPYISAAVLIQFLTMGSSPLQQIRRGGERGRKLISLYTLYLALLLTVVQAYGLSVGLEGFQQLVAEPGLLFRISTVLTLTGGTFFLIWLSEQIALGGIGNGLALILFVGVVMDVPAAIVDSIDFASRGVFESNLMFAIAVFMVLFIGFIVFVELARRRVPLEFAGRAGGYQTRTSDLCLKLNSAGVIPLTAASLVLTLPLMLASFAGGLGPSWFRAFAEQFAPGAPGFMISTVVAVVLLALLYTAFVLDPEDAAEKLKRYGGVIPGVEPGEATAEYLDNVVSRTAMFGTAYLVLVALIPQFLLAFTQLPFYFGGVSALVAVCVVLDIGAQVRGDGLVNTGG